MLTLMCEAAAVAFSRYAAVITLCYTALIAVAEISTVEKKAVRWRTPGTAMLMRACRGVPRHISLHAALDSRCSPRPARLRRASSVARRFPSVLAPACAAQWLISTAAMPPVLLSRSARDSYCQRQIRGQAEARSRLPCCCRCSPLQFRESLSVLPSSFARPAFLQFPPKMSLVLCLLALRSSSLPIPKIRSLVACAAPRRRRRRRSTGRCSATAASSTAFRLARHFLHTALRQRRVAHGLLPEAAAWLPSARVFHQRRHACSQMPAHARRARPTGPRACFQRLFPEQYLSPAHRLSARQRTSPALPIPCSVFPCAHQFPCVPVRHAAAAPTGPPTCRRFSAFNSFPPANRPARAQVPMCPVTAMDRHTPGCDSSSFRFGRHRRSQSPLTSLMLRVSRVADALAARQVAAVMPACSHAVSKPAQFAAFALKRH